MLWAPGRVPLSSRSCHLAQAEPWFRKGFGSDSVYLSNTFLTLANTGVLGNEPKEGELTHLGPHRVLNAHHSNAGELADHLILIVPVGLLGCCKVPVGNTYSAQSVTRHGLNDLLHHVFPVPRSETTQLTVAVQDVGAPAAGPDRQRAKPMGESTALQNPFLLFPASQHVPGFANQVMLSSNEVTAQRWPLRMQLTSSCTQGRPEP